MALENEIMKIEVEDLKRQLAIAKEALARAPASAPVRAPASTSTRAPVSARAQPSQPQTRNGKQGEQNNNLHK